MGTMRARRRAAPAHAIVFLVLGALPLERRGGRCAEPSTCRRERRGSNSGPGSGSGFDGKALPKLLHLLGEGFHFGGLIFGARLEHLLALKEDLQLLLSVLQLILGAPELLYRLVPIPARPVVQDFSGQAGLFFAPVSKLQGGNRIQGSLEGVARRASKHAGGLEATQGALKGSSLLL
jgi:hypothetical protein